MMENEWVRKLLNHIDEVTKGAWDQSEYQVILHGYNGDQREFKHNGKTVKITLIYRCSSGLDGEMYNLYSTHIDGIFMCIKAPIDNL